MYKTTVFIQNLYILVKYFGKNFIFSVKSKIFWFSDQMYIFGYKTTVFIQTLYILVKFFGKNFNFSVKSTIFFFGTKYTFLDTKLHFLSKICTKFVHFGEIFWQKLHFYCKKYNFFHFLGPNVDFWVQNYGFYPKLVNFGQFLAKTSFLE